MVLRQVALSCAERIGFICFIVKFSFVCYFEKKGCPRQEETALNLFHFIYLSSLRKT